MSAPEVLAELRALGTPAPQGSKTAFVIPATGRAGMKESAGKRHASWRDAVGAAALVLVEHRPELYPLDGALGLEVEFRFPLGTSAPKWQQALGRLPKYTAPDTSKLVRATEDALQAAGLIRDDARFCRLAASKWEVVGWTGAHIRVTREEYPTRHSVAPLEQLELTERGAPL